MHNAIIKPQWSPVTIALMVLGFVIFWPLGLAMLAYILWGEYFGGSSEKAERWINKQKDWARDRRHRYTGNMASGNAAFDDYRSEQLKRLEEERHRLDDEVHEFHEYMHNLRKARDREEFDRFMRDRRSERSPRDESPRDDSDRDSYRQGY